jgi:hypothetical protein
MPSLARTSLRGAVERESIQASRPLCAQWRVNALAADAFARMIARWRRARRECLGGSGLPVGEPVRRLGAVSLAEKCLCAIERLAIGDAHALVQSQVLQPRFVHEALHE